MAKRSIICITAAAALAATIGCGSHNEKELTSTAREYIQAMADYRIDDARPYATEETERTTINFILGTIMPNIDSTYIEQNTPAEITIERVEWLSDTAAIVHYHKTTPIQQNVKATLEMRQRNGEWKAYQVIRPTGILGGNVGAVDTAEMRKMRLENPDSVPAVMPKIRIKI